MKNRENPWSNAANQAVGALYKHYMTMPSQAEMQNQELQNQVLMGRIKANESALETDALQRSNIRSTMADRNFKLDQLKRENDIANAFTEAYQSVPAVTPGDVLPQDVQGPVRPGFTEADQNAAIADVFAQFAPQLSADRVSATRDALGTVNALRLEDPLQRQLAIDKKASNVSAFDSSFTLPPGSGRYSGDGELIVQQPTKENQGSYVQLADGTTISIDGGMPQIPAGKTVTGAVQKDQVSMAQMRGTLDLVRELALEDSANFGVQGLVKGGVQNAGALISGISTTLGYQDPSMAVNDVRMAVMNNPNVDPGLLPGLFEFDPSLPSLQTASDLLVFQAAAALAGQSGRSVSDRDIKLFKNMVGDPRQLFTSQERYLAKLDTIEKMLENNENVANRTLGGNVTGPVDPLTASQDAIQQRENEIGANPYQSEGPAQPIQIQSDADYDQLPSGTQFIAPDGTTRVKP